MPSQYQSTHACRYILSEESLSAMYGTKEDTPSIINNILLPVPRRCYNFSRTDSRDIKTMLANLTTVQQWSKELDSLVSGCVGMNREEKSRVSFVLVVL